MPAKKSARSSNKNTSSSLINKLKTGKGLLGLVVIIFFVLIGALALFKSRAAKVPTVAILGLPDHQGYYLVQADGGVISEGSAAKVKFPGSAYGKISAGIADGALSPSGHGYWLLGADGKVYSFGDAHDHGNHYQPGSSRWVAIVDTPSGNGYWLVSKYGYVSAYGDAATTYVLDGSVRNYKHNADFTIPGLSSVGIVDADKSVDGKGLFMIDANGHGYTIGKSASWQIANPVALHLSKHEQLTGISADAGWRSFVLSTNEGRVITSPGFTQSGDAYQYFVNGKLQGAVLGVSAFVSGGATGYWLVGYDGGVFAFGAAHYYGGTAKDQPLPILQPPKPVPPTQPIGSTGGGNTDACKSLDVKNIKQLQLCLNQKGANPRLVVDGILGPKTRAACAQVFKGYCPYPPVDARQYPPGLTGSCGDVAGKYNDLKVRRVNANSRYNANISASSGVSWDGQPYRSQVYNEILDAASTEHQLASVVSFKFNTSYYYDIAVGCNGSVSSAAQARFDYAYGLAVSPGALYDRLQKALNEWSNENTNRACRKFGC